MSCATNPWQYYNQCTGVQPQWFVQNDGCTNVCGCLPQSYICTPIKRRFSPYCKFIEVLPSAPQLYLRVAASAPTDSQSLTFAHSRVTLELRRKGCETMLASYPAWRRDARGYIGFYFDTTYFAQPSGYYIGDVFIDCIYCFSINLRKPCCEALVTDCYVQPALDTCGTGDCGLADSIGEGVIGGVGCDVSCVTICGPVAPFFSLDNPIPEEPACSTNFACGTSTPTTIAGTCIG